MAQIRRQRAGARRRVGLAVAAAVAAAIVIAAAMLGGVGSQPVADTATQGAKSTVSYRVAVMVLAAPLVAAWCYSACRRCTDRFVQRCLVGICGLCLFWILDILVKYPASQEGLVRALWYLFYIPIIFIPLLCSYIALHMAKSGSGRGLLRYRRISTAVSLALLVLVLTNDWHHLVFVVDYGTPGWGRDYTYGPGYAVIFAWVVALLAVCLGALLITARRELRRAIAFLLVLFGVIGAYALCYALRIEPVFSSSVAVFNTVFIVATFEAALDLGLVPVQRRQRAVFRLLPFKLEIVDDAGRTCYKTAAAEDDEAFGSLDSHIHYEITPLSSGYSILEKDTTQLDRKADELKRIHEQLESQHELLQAEYHIDGRVRVQRAQEELYDEVSWSLTAGVRRAAALMGNLPPEDAGEAGRRQRREMLAEAKLLLGACKQKGACIIDARQCKEFSGDYLTLLFAEAEANLRSLGIACAVVNQADALTAHQLCLLLDELYDWACALLFADGPAIVAHLAPEGNRVRLRLMVECTDSERALDARRRLQVELGEGTIECAEGLDASSVMVDVMLSARPGSGVIRPDDVSDGVASDGRSPAVEPAPDKPAEPAVRMAEPAVEGGAA